MPIYTAMGSAGQLNTDIHVYPKNVSAENIKEMTNEKYIMKETTLYSAFSRLEKNGYISSYSGDETNGKRRTYYKLTNEGLIYYKEKCQEWQITKEVVDKFIKEM